MRQTQWRLFKFSIKAHFTQALNTFLEAFINVFAFGFSFTLCLCICCVQRSNEIFQRTMATQRFTYTNQQQINADAFHSVPHHEKKLQPTTAQNFTFAVVVGVINVMAM